MKIREKMLPVLGPQGGEEEVQAAMDEASMHELPELEKIRKRS